jgi:hypothetical protein
MLRESDSVEEIEAPNVSKVHHHQAHSVSVVGKINDEIFKNSSNNDEEDEGNCHLSPYAIPLTSPSKIGRSTVWSLKIRVLEIVKAELHSEAPLDIIEMAYSSV